MTKQLTFRQKFEENHRFKSLECFELIGDEWPDNDGSAEKELEAKLLDKNQMKFKNEKN